MSKFGTGILVLWLVLGMTSLAQAQQYQTPAPTYASFEPEANDLGSQSPLMDEVADGFHYFHAINVVNVYVGSMPTATVWDWYDILHSGNIGLIFVMAHSDFDRMDAAVYDLTTSQYDADYNALKAAFGSAALYKSTHLDDFGNPVYRVIGVNANFIQSYFLSANTVVLHNGCSAWGLSNSYGAARGFCSYTDAATNSYMLDVTREMAKRLVNTYSIPSQRVVVNAWQGIELSNGSPASLYRGRDLGTVMAPAIQSVTISEGQTISALTAVDVVFDCPMYTSASVATIVGSEGSVSVSNWSWLNNHQLRGTVTPTYRGDGVFRIHASQGSPLDGAASANNVPLDGNTSPFIGPNCRAENQDDYIVNVISPVGGDNPAAVVSAFRVEGSDDGVRGRMMTDVEAGSDSFFVQRSASPTGPFIEVVSWPATGPHEYVFDDPNGNVGDWYECYEVDTAGVRTRMDSKQAVPPMQYTPDAVVSSSAGDSLTAAMLQLYPTPHLAQPDQILPILNWAAIIPDESYRSALQPLANKHNAEGLVSEIYTMADINSAYGSNQNFAKAWRPYGLRFILRWGDFNNWRYHNNPLYYNAATGWSNYPYGAQPQYDIMPVQYVIDPSGHMNGSTTYVTPDVPRILDGDVDGDSLNEVAVGIFPCRSPAEAVLMVRKQLKYQQQTAPTNRHLTMYVDGRNLNGNNGPYAQQLADSIARAIGTLLSVVELINNDVLNLPYSTRQAQASSDMATLPMLIMPFGVTTTRVNWAFLNKIDNFSWSQTPTVSFYTFLDGWSCDLVDFDRSEDTVTLPYNSRPIFEDAMKDTLHGPACGVGALRGTFIRGDFYAALAFHDIILRHGAPSAGEAFVAALHKVMTEYPEYAFQYRTFVYFGDPAAIIPGMVVNATTAIGGQRAVASFELSTPYPNPVRGHSTIRYSLPTSTKVTLSVIDVQGRVVSELADSVQPAGMHNVTFAAGNNTPGVYFLRLQAGTVTRVEKMIVIR